MRPVNSEAGLEGYTMEGETLDQKRDRLAGEIAVRMQHLMMASGAHCRDCGAMLFADTGRVVCVAWGTYTVCATPCTDPAPPASQWFRRIVRLPRDRSRC